MNLKKTIQLDDIKDILLVVGVISAPMTSLRIWKVGPGEVLCLLYCIVNYRSLKHIPKRDIFFKFWLGFLVALSFGTIWGTYKYPSETIPIDLLTWFYLSIISIGVHLILKEKKDIDIIGILMLSTYGAAFWYYFLFLYSRRVSYYFFGAPLWFAGVRFTGGATNPHQVALLLCFSLIVFTWRILNKKSFKSRVFNGMVFVISLFLLKQTQSSTAIMAVTVGLGTVVWQHFWVHYKDKNTLFITVFIVTTIIVFLFGKRIYHLFISWVAADRNGMDRLEIFSSFPTAFFKGPIFGLGPGTHARGGVMEFHNSYLEIVAMSGLLGAMIFIVFSVQLLRITYRSPLSLGLIIAAYTYGFSGFSARRLVYWTAVVLAYDYANIIKIRDNTNKS